jgi:YfiH family protein
MEHGQSIHDPAVDRKGQWVSSRLLGAIPGLSHGFTLRSAGDFAEAAVTHRLLLGTGASRLRLLRQVHGTRVISPEEKENVPEADAWAGVPAPGVLLAVQTADCLPVLLCHPPSGRLGLAHAGWRGATGGIALSTVKAMGVPAEELVAALGPSIGPCCYEVGVEVAAAAGTGSPHVRTMGGGKYRFDLQGYVRSQLRATGMSEQNIERLPYCTGCRTDLFFSYRKEGTTGRLCAFLGWQVRDRDN